MELRLKADAEAEDDVKTDGIADNDKSETSEGEAQKENTESESSTEAAADAEAAEKAVSVEDAPVTDSAFTVVEAENPEKAAAAIAENNNAARSRNNRSKKRKKKKAAQNKVVDIWDEGTDVESQVADLHKKGLSIMEIANKLGIGVGEAKVMIDKINEADKQ